MSTLMPGHAPLKPHPIANLFPMLADSELANLGADIKANGQVETVKLFQGMILDGRNRYNACVRLNLPVRTEIFSGSMREALDWVISKNLHRRHLTESQRALVAAQIGRLKLGDNQHTRTASSGPTLFGPVQTAAATPAHPASPAQICAGSAETGICAGDGDAIHSGVASEEGASVGPDVRPAGVPPSPSEAPMSQGERAGMTKVSRRSVQHADELVAKGAPELVEKVASGEIRVSAAAEIASLPIEEQRAIIAQANPKAVKDVAKQNRADRAKVGRERRLKNMTKTDATPLLDGGEPIGVFYLDIPREFAAWSEETGADKSPENHYRVESLRFLCDLRERILKRAAPNSVMFMWGWANSLQDQLDLLAEFGFASVRRRDEAGRLLRDASGEILPPVGEGRYRSHQVWVKRASTGNLNRGMGFWFIDCHELLLVGCRGDVPAPLMGTQAMSVIEAVIGAHSEKPNEIFRDQIDHYFPGVKKLELFGRTDDVEAFRKRWPDWEIIGNDVAVATPQGVVDIATGATSSSSPARTTTEMPPSPAGAEEEADTHPGQEPVTTEA